ncbi:prostaglandin reductase 1-like [Cottoperca gobio]|uniref:15-oxoprostaglandin 13-reductase n=1 Tax=Cottoperca gobio TaxID=56716 RepID=A0A6J2RPI9_COTGO|nr:prostaglandin reductase 1-like [Cottoperca gobio]
MVQAKTWSLTKHFDGFPKDSDLELKVEELPLIKLSEQPQNNSLEHTCFLFLQTLKAHCHHGRKLDEARHLIDRCFLSSSVVLFFCRVIQSNNPAFPVGSHVIGRCGWRTHTVCDGTDLIPIMPDWPQDEAFNYKTVGSLEETLKKASPDGYDCFFENVGGPSSSVALQQMKNFGRIAVCGAISTYNDTTPQTGGKLQCREHITQGFEKMPAAFMGILKGENVGKAIVAI